MRKLASFVAMPAALLTVGAAPALGAPAVTTSPATNVTDTSATLNGTINGQGEAVAYSFAYGTSVAYGSFSQPGFLPPSNTPQPVSATVTGLRPNTVYHFRLGSTGQQPVFGQDLTFKTKAPVRRQPSLTLKVRPARDRSLPYKFTSSGTLKRPAGVSKADGCSGTVSVQIKSGTKTISTRRVKVRSDCTYKSSVTFKSRGRLKARGTLKVTARYGGSQFLKSATSKSTRVRYGR